MKKLLLAVAAALSLAYTRLTERFTGGPMDGTSWEVRVKPDVLFAFSRRDTLVFDQGRLAIAGYVSSGFPPATYNAQVLDSDSRVFSAVLTRPDHGVMNWQGMVRGDSIEGVAVLWSPDGRSRRFHFRGSRRGDG